MAAPNETVGAKTKTKITSEEFDRLMAEQERDEELRESAAQQGTPVQPVPGPEFHKDFIKDRDDLRLAVKAATVGLTADEIAELSAAAAAPFTREEGVGEMAPPVVAKRKRIKYRETGSCDDKLIQWEPDDGSAWLMVEYPSPRPDAPWLIETVTARLAVGALASFVIEEAE